MNFQQNKVNYQQLVKDVTFDRDHLIYVDWNDWKKIAYRYHSAETSNLLKAINEGKCARYDYDDFSEHSQFFITDVWHMKIDNELNIMDGSTIEKQFYKLNMRSSCYCECYHVPDPNCWAFEFHMKAHLMALLWTQVSMNKFRKSYRKYYKRLQRVIIALDMERLLYFPLTLITEPQNYVSKGRFLLRHLYQVAIFDEYKQDSVLDFVERAKHFLNQDIFTDIRATQQSGSDTNLFSDNILIYGARLIKKYTYDQLVSMFMPKQQGLFGVDFNHSFKDSDMTKFKEIFVSSQKAFVSGLAEVALTTGQSLAVMFAVAGTVSLLAKRALNFTLDVIVKVLHLIYSLIFGPTDEELCVRYYAQQQSNYLSLPFLPAMLLNYVIAPSKTILKAIWGNKDIDLVMKRLGYLGDVKIDKGLDRVIEWIKDVIYNVQSWYCREILGVPVTERLENCCPEIETWKDKVQELLKEYFEGTYVWSDTNWSVLYNLYATGLRFTRTEYLKKYKNDVWKIVQQLGNLLEKFKTHHRSDLTIRNPPVTIYLAGGSGVGKSTITYPLAAAVLKHIFRKEGNKMDLKKYWKSLVYTRNSEQVYWDAYDNQLVTVFDDFNQITDSSSSPSLELFEIIRASNCFPYPLHMASLDQKATTAFTSKIIVVSSNMEKPRTQSLNFPEALLNRFNICIRVDRKPEFKGKRLSTFDPNIFTFMQYDIKTNSDIGLISYDKLVELCVFEYFARRDFVDSVDRYIENDLSEFDPATLDTDCNPFEIMQQGGRIDDIHDPLLQEAVNEIPLMSRELMEKIAIPGVIPGSREQLPIYKTIYRTSLMDLVDGILWTGKKVKDYFFPKDSWQQLAEAVQRLDQRKNEWRAWWKKFQEKHSYMVKAGTIVAMILTGIMFVKTFSSIKNMLAAKKTSPVLISTSKFAQQWNSHRETRVASEGYTPLSVRPAKTEAYTPVAVKGPKVESYNPSAVKMSKVESLIFDPKTGLPEAQGVKDMNATEILMSVARRNLYKVYESTTNTPIGHVLFLKGKVAIMPRHFLYGMEQAVRNNPMATLYFKSILLERGFECYAKDVLESRFDYQSPEEDQGEAPVTRDLTAIVVDTAIVHPDVVPYFSTKSSLNYVNVTEVVLPVMVNNNVKGSVRDILMIRFRKGKSALQRIVDPLPIGDENSHVVRYVRDAWRYECDTQPTECGAPVIVRNSQISPGKICGIHIAGIEGTGEGFATPVYQEDIIEILSKFTFDKILSQRQRVELNDFPTQQGQIPDAAEFIRLGQLKEKLHQPVISKIEPSLCYNTYKEPETKPCQLRPNKTFDPRGYRLERLGNIPQALSRDVIENARDALLDEISTVVASNEASITEHIKAVYSFDEAVAGIDGEIYVNSLKRTTSPGFPFVKQPKFSTRKKIFGESETYDLQSPECEELRKRVREIIECARRGEVLDHYFVDTLKDERKPIHKAHKTRLFSAGPIDYLIACKMYFNGSVALLQKNRNVSHVSVGTNPYSEDWSEIAKVLLRKSRCMVAGDFEGFDASQHQLLLQAAGEVFIRLSRRFLEATEEDERIMRVLLTSLFNSMHITADEVYQWTHSLPSGHYLTAPINSIFVNLAFGCIWQIAFDSVSYLTARSFWNECGIVAYGDDHILSIPQNRLEKFNQFTIPGLFKLMGLSYTMEDKDAIVSAPYRKLTEISYLKRGFYIDQANKWLAPLSLSTVLETPQWVHKTPDIRAQTIENLEWALKELSLHPESIWNVWAPKLKEQQAKLGFYTGLQHQMDARTVCLSQKFDM